MLHGISLICISPKISCLKKKMHNTTLLTRHWICTSQPAWTWMQVSPRWFFVASDSFSKKMSSWWPRSHPMRGSSLLHPRLYKGWTIFLPQNMVKNGKWIYHQDSFFQDRWKFSNKIPWWFWEKRPAWPSFGLPSANRCHQGHPTQYSKERGISFHLDFWRKHRHPKFSDQRVPVFFSF